MEIQNISAFENKFDTMINPSEPKQVANNVMFEGIMNSMNEMRQIQEVGKAEMAQVLLGNSENAHNALIALEKANLQMTFAANVRDKATQGINQLLNMQI